MSKHTPRPWQQHDADYCPLEIWGDLDGPLEAGQVRGTLVCVVEDERDVPIILAAPDLLEALKLVAADQLFEALPSVVVNAVNHAIQKSEAP